MGLLFQVLEIREGTLERNFFGPASLDLIGLKIKDKEGDLSLAYTTGLIECIYLFEMRTKYSGSHCFVFLLDSQTRRIAVFS